LQIIITNEAALATACPGRCAAIRIEIGIANEPALTRTTAGHCTAHGLTIGIPNEATLATAAAVGRSAESLHVCILNETALSAATAGACSTLSLKVGVFDKTTLTILGKRWCHEHGQERKKFEKSHFHPLRQTSSIWVLTFLGGVSRSAMPKDAPFSQISRSLPC
jgi:hypothetical protein